MHDAKRISAVQRKTRTKMWVRLKEVLCVFILFVLGTSSSIYAADSIKSCQQAEAMFTITPTPSSLSMGPNSNRTIDFQITNNTGTTIVGLDNLALTFSRLGINASVTNNGCLSMLANNASCDQIVTITSPEQVSSGTFFLSASVCDSGSPTKFCARTCQPITVTIPPTPPSTTTLAVSPNPANLTAAGSGMLITLMNTGTHAAQGITFFFDQPDLGVTMSNSNCGNSLQPSTSCTFTLNPGITQGSTNLNIVGSNFPRLAEAINIGPPATTTIDVSPNPIALDANGSAQNLTVTNTGSAPALNISFTSPTPDIGLQVTNSCPVILAAAQTCLLTLQPGAIFGPTTFNVSGSNTNTVTEFVVINPPGMPTIDVTPNPQTLPQNSTASEFITNIGSVPVTGLQAVVNPPDLGLTVTGFGTPACPDPLLPQNTCQVTINSVSTPGTTTIDFSGTGSNTVSVSVTVL